MKRRLGWGLTLAVCAAADAAEPVVPSPERAAATAFPAPVAKPAPSAKPLNLRIGEVRTYMMPNEYRAALGAPDADKDTVVVEAKRELLPMKSEKPVPGGIIAPFWAIAHPIDSWRIFVPDLKAPPEGPREPADKVPPPIFRWGP